MEIGPLPLSIQRLPGGDPPRQKASDPVGREPRDTSAQIDDDPSAVTLGGRALRARIAIREADADRFNLQADLSRRTRSALETYLSVQQGTEDDSVPELVGLDVVV